MSPRTARLLLALYLGAIYATLGSARTISNALRDAGWLRFTVGVTFVAVAVIVLAVLLRDPRLRSAKMLLTLAITAGVYAAVTAWMDSPEEKLHFVEYGGAALLAYAACPVEWPSWKRSVTAALLVAAAGWIDEGIQALLPTRYYDLRDVGFNAAAGVMALLALSAVRKVRGR